MQFPRLENATRFAYLNQPVDSRRCLFLDMNTTQLFSTIYWIFPLLFLFLARCRFLIWRLIQAAEALPLSSGVVSGWFCIQLVVLHHAFVSRPLGVSHLSVVWCKAHPVDNWSTEWRFLKFSLFADTTPFFGSIFALSVFVKLSPPTARPSTFPLVVLKNVFRRCPSLNISTTISPLWRQPFSSRDACRRAPHRDPNRRWLTCAKAV